MFEAALIHINLKSNQIEVFFIIFDDQNAAFHALSPS